MTMPIETKGQSNQIRTIMEELNSLTNLLQAYQQKAKPSSVSACSQNGVQPVSRSYHHASGSKVHGNFPVSFNKSITNNYKNISKRTSHVAYPSQNSNHSSKFTFVGKNQTLYTNTKPLQNLPKSAAISTNISQPGNKYKLNRTNSLACKVVDFRNNSKKTNAESQRTDPSCRRTVRIANTSDVNNIQTVGNKINFTLNSTSNLTKPKNPLCGSTSNSVDYIPKSSMSFSPTSHLASTFRTVIPPESSTCSSTSNSVNVVPKLCPALNSTSHLADTSRTVIPPESSTCSSNSVNAVPKLCVTLNSTSNLGMTSNAVPSKISLCRSATISTESVDAFCVTLNSTSNLAKTANQIPPQNPVFNSVANTEDLVPKSFVMTNPKTNMADASNTVICLKNSTCHSGLNSLNLVPNFCVTLNSTSNLAETMNTEKLLKRDVRCSNSLDLIPNSINKPMSIDRKQCSGKVESLVPHKKFAISGISAAKYGNKSHFYSVNKDKFSLTSSENKHVLKASQYFKNNKSFKYLANRGTTVINMTSPKSINGHPKRTLSSKYKVVNKKSPFVKRLKPTIDKKESPEFNTGLTIKPGGILSSTPKAISGGIFKKSPKANGLLFSAKRLPLRERRLVQSKFKVINKNRSFTLKLKEITKNSVTVNNVTKPSPVLKLRKPTASRYELMNQRKTAMKANHSRLMALIADMKFFSSKYKIAKKKNPLMGKPAFLCSKGGLKKSEAANLESKLDCKAIVSTDLGDKSVKKEIQLAGLLKQKISRLKFIKNSDYEGYDLTDISPDELVSMDTASLLKLSAMIKSSNNKRQSFVKKSKYKLVSKEPSLSNQVARMVKAKYRVRNQRSHYRSWEAGQTARKGTSYQRNHKYHKIVNSYQKHNAFKSHFRRSSPSKNNRYKKTNFVVIGDIPYRISRNKMTKTTRKTLTPQCRHSNNTSRVIIVRGERFKMDPSGKSLKKLSNDNSSNKASLKRIDLGGKTYINRGSGILEQTTSPQIRNLTSRMLHRSIQTVWASTARKESLKKSNIYCMFFNRFGKCNRETNCPYIHDPNKIAVCTRFLRGTCKATDCPFSHVKSPGKMAICSFYLQGLCTNKDCPYRHEQLNPDAKLCKAFVRGYCSLGIKCTKAHILVCPEYIHGKCEKGKSCAYPHPPKREKKEDDLGVAKDMACDSKESELLKSVTSKDDESDDEVFRYFNLVPLSPKETSCRKRKMGTVHDKTKKLNVHCKPQRNKAMDCPLFIPLSFDDDSS